MNISAETLKGCTFISASGKLLNDPASFSLNARNEKEKLTNDMPSITGVYDLYGLSPRLTAAENAYAVTPKMN